MAERDPKKFDPANAAALDAPERQAYLPTAALVSMLELGGGETVVDYGAGTGTVAFAAAAALAGGKVFAVDESDAMLDRLKAGPPPSRVQPVLARDNATGLPSAVADRVLAINVMHEIRGEEALSEMRRLLTADGFLLLVDWQRGIERSFGPPDELLYTAAEAEAELRDAGFEPRRLEADFPFHFALRATRA